MSPRPAVRAASSRVESADAAAATATALQPVEPDVETHLEDELPNLQRRPGAVLRRPTPAVRAVPSLERPTAEVAPVVSAPSAPAAEPKPAHRKPPKVKTPKPARVKVPKPPKVEAPKPARVKVAKPAKAPRSTKQRGSQLELGATEGVEFATSGWWGIVPATFVVTTYRVAVTRLGRTRWIPLEEVRKTRARRGRVTIDASIEQLRFRTKRVRLAALAESLDRGIAEARRANSRRHDAGVLQAWCDRCEIWDTHTGRIRLWINRHPLLVLALVGALVALVRVYVTPH